MKVRKIIRFIGGFLIFYFIYLGAYQWIINQSFAFEEKQCKKVNPLIIARKNTYLDSMRLLVAVGATDKYFELDQKYKDITRKYIDAQKKWLDEDSEFLSRWYMNIIVDKNTQDALRLQHSLYESKMKGSVLMLDMFKDAYENDGKDQKELYQKIVKNAEDSDNLSDQLTKKQDQIFKISQKSLRNRILRYPKPTCPQENYNIPDVDKELKELFDDTNSEPLPGITG